MHRRPFRWSRRRHPCWALCWAWQAHTDLGVRQWIVMISKVVKVALPCRASFSSVGWKLCDLATPCLDTYFFAEYPSMLRWAHMRTKTHVRVCMCTRPRAHGAHARVHGCTPADKYVRACVLVRACVCAPTLPSHPRAATVTRAPGRPYTDLTVYRAFPWVALLDLRSVGAALPAISRPDHTHDLPSPHLCAAIALLTTRTPGAPN